MTMLEVIRSKDRSRGSMRMLSDRRVFTVPEELLVVLTASPTVALIDREIEKVQKEV